MLLRLDATGQLYRQIYRALRERIVRGQLRGGNRLPSTRALAEELGVSRNVCILAYEQLEAEGYIEVRPRSRVSVKRGQERPSAYVAMLFLPDGVQKETNSRPSPSKRLHGR